MSNTEDCFYGKILLFGEYSVLLDSMALSLPFRKFKGELKLDRKRTELTKKSNSDLREYLHYLKSISADLKGVLDLIQLENDIENGLYFDSTIPQSYGLGSSGALSAAIYQAYSINRLESDTDLFNLKKIFILLESGFHGTSSGIDPLISYLNQALLITGKNQILTVELNYSQIQKDGTFFLVDTKQKGSTGPLVSNFLDNCKDIEYKNEILNKLKPLTNHCIKSFCDNDISSLALNLKQLSSFQLHNFKDKIPTEFLELWQNGLDSNKFYMKLCGSGGGGYLLGFTKDITDTKIYLSKLGHDCEPLTF